MTLYELLKTVSDDNNHIRIAWGRNSRRLFVAVVDETDRRHGRYVETEEELIRMLTEHVKPKK
jgi:hypothetical protein